MLQPKWAQQERGCFTLLLLLLLPAAFLAACSAPWQVLDARIVHIT
jgi:hypothetical protein